MIRCCQFRIFLIAFAGCLTFTGLATAHDTWVQTNTNLIRTGDAIHINLMLGNHGNEHRDFKLASKTGLDGAVLQVHAPNGKSFDLLPQLVDVGYAPKEGFWTAKFAPAANGLYVVEHRLDKIVNHGKPTRSLKSGKTLFVVSASLDNVSTEQPGYDRVLGHALELIPVSNPVVPMGPGQSLKVQLRYKGKPLGKTRVSFIPRRETLSEDFDSRFERMTDADGTASFTPKTGDYYLVVAHHLEPAEKGDGYESTKYSATLCVYVPEICPCCGE